MTARRTNVPLVFLNAFPLDSEQWEPPVSYTHLTLPTNREV